MVLFTEVHKTAGKPPYPLNELRTSPYFLLYSRISFSAKALSSKVETSERTASATLFRIEAAIKPLTRISSISAGVFILTIGKNLTLSLYRRAQVLWAVRHL